MSVAAIAERATRRDLDGLVRGASRLAPSREDAEDAVQEAWAQLLERERRGHEFDAAGLGLVAHGARSRAIDAHRRRVGRGERSLDRMVEDAGDAGSARAPDALLDQVEARLALRELAAEAPGGRAALKLARKRLGEFVRFEPDEVVDSVRGFVERHGYVPTCEQFCADPLCPSWIVVHRCFTRWSALMREAGYEVYDKSTTAARRDDALVAEVAALARREGTVSQRMLRERMGLGWKCARRLVARLEAEGVVGPHPGGNAPRKLLAPACVSS